MMLTLRDFLVFTEVVRTVGLTALRATSPPAGHKASVLKQRHHLKKKKLFITWGAGFMCHYLFLTARCERCVGISSSSSESESCSCRERFFSFSKTCREKKQYE